MNTLLSLNPTRDKIALHRSTAGVLAHVSAHHWSIWATQDAVPESQDLREAKLLGEEEGDPAERVELGVHLRRARSRAGYDIAG